MEQRDDISFLFEDPRPTLPDANLWTKLLRAIPVTFDSALAEKLQRRIWTMRSLGIALRYVAGVWRFVPILDETGGYDSEAEFEQDKKQYLTEYAKEIAQLLERVTGHE